MTRRLSIFFCAGVALSLISTCIPAHAAEPLKLGIIGLDTSHVISITQILNDISRPDHVPGAVVVAAYRGGSPDMELSAGRIDEYTAQVVQRWHIRIVDSIPELCRQVDAVLLLSVDGRKHLEQARAVFAARKPVFIDKPFASSFKEAQEIVRLSRQSGVPFFSCSPMRFANDIVEIRQDESIGRIEGAFTFGPGLLERHVPDLFWYDIHAVEALYTLMGPGCERVSRVSTDGEDSVIGLWKDARIGGIRGLRSSPRMEGAVVFGSKRTVVSRNLLSEKPTEISSYPQLCSAIVKFFVTGVPPVPPEETLEIIAFMEAADRSRDRNGAPVPIAEITSQVSQ